MRLWGLVAVAAFATLAIVAWVVWRPGRDETDDMVADSMISRRACTDVTRESVKLAELRPSVRKLGESAEELTELTCLSQGPSMVLLKFTSTESAEAAFQLKSERIGAGCVDGNTVVLAGPGSGRDTAETCANLH